MSAMCSLPAEAAQDLLLGQLAAVVLRVPQVHLLEESTSHFHCISSQCFMHRLKRHKRGSGQHVNCAAGLSLAFHSRGTIRCCDLTSAAGSEGLSSVPAASSNKPLNLGCGRVPKPAKTASSCSHGSAVKVRLAAGRLCGLRPGSLACPGHS